MSGPCDWPVEDCPGGGEHGSCPDVSDAIRELADDLAGQLLWAWTDRRFGLCERTVRPCDDRQVRCGCGSRRASCGCTDVPELVLSGPVASVTAVWVDGELLDETAYRVDDWRWLVRTDGGVWPSCSNLLADPDEAGSFVVTYQAGYPVPPGTGLITALLACELALALCQDDSCRLPRRIQSMTRQGVTISFSDLDDGRTGLPEVDMWVSAQRRPPRRATVWSPDVVVPRQTTWAAGTSP